MESHFWEVAVLDPDVVANASLTTKHSMIRNLHAGPAYEKENLKTRVNEYLDMMVAVNTRRADTVVDVTPDNIQLSAIETLYEVKQQRKNEIDLRLGSYSPMGFMDSEPERWELLEQGLKYADFIGSLPESDDQCDYPDRIGFYEHMKRMLLLSREHHKELHVHVDQRNDASETGTEQLIRAMKEVGAPVAADGSPMVWAIHVISPSTYEENRFQQMLNAMVEVNLGVICCPSAALGMRQLRMLTTPTYNSIARVLEMLAAGLTVRLGTDNMADICSPSTTANLVDEIYILTAALRFYNIDTLARIAAGQKLNTSERRHVIEHLESNKAEIARTIKKLQRK
jgi:hypothetical protein